MKHFRRHVDLLMCMNTTASRNTNCFFMLEYTLVHDGRICFSCNSRSCRRLDSIIFWFKGSIVVCSFPLIKWLLKSIP
jgi:hypothetical protein